MSTVDLEMVISMTDSHEEAADGRWGESDDGLDGP